ncbi:putative RNA polymerase II subunit B1 CTD phosphatase RPAP2 [Asterias rubens]|uniref:putative RNA polymerase II subunit B1 CTD phosphatase RPAP2 n=1 Tax=Asterias rubens TaxID=7604 RepID=UPI0014556818|nr:putative RNA polymerase II subunit B1 CTD phosphatase RPAP2 [Asterias rubens]
MSTNKSSQSAGGAARSEEEETKRRAMLEEQVQMRLAIDNKALQIVERLLDNPITEDFLVDCSKFIITQHYKDAVEERSILKQCGYPLCQRSLSDVPNQKYHISRKTNKVYDITERKNFCRQFCYKASKFYEAQLSDSPLWARDLEGPLDLKLLTEDMETDSEVADLIAKDHVLLTERIQTEDIDSLGIGKIDKPLKEEAIGLLADDLSSMTFAGTRRRERLQELDEISGSDTTSQDEPRTVVNLIDESGEDDLKDGTEFTEGSKKEIVKESESHTKQNPEVDIQTAKTSNQAESSPKMTQGESKKKTKKKSKKIHQNVVKEISLLDVVGKAVMEWTTAATLDFIHGCNPSDQENPTSQEPESMACGKAPATSDPTCPSATSDPTCSPVTSDLTGPPVKPLPGMERLKEETQNYDLRVQEFYYGQSVEVKKEKKKSGGVQEKDEVDRKIRLPLVDSKSQMAIRRRIVNDRLKREYYEILAPMRLSLRDIASDIQGLLCTFHLGSHNITFKPASWTMLAILLLTM